MAISKQHDNCDGQKEIFWKCSIIYLSKH